MYNNKELITELEEQNKVFADHITERNRLMEGMMIAKGWVGLGNRPMCPHCEQPAVRDRNDYALCFKCGKRWKPYITFDEYVKEYVKNVPSETIEKLRRQE